MKNRLVITVILYSACFLFVSCGENNKSSRNNDSENGSNWSQPLSGLSCRLVCAKEKYSILGTVPITLEIRNDSDADVTFNLKRLHKSFRVFDLNGREFLFQGRQPRREPAQIRLKGGEVHKVEYSLRPENHMLSARPYEIHFQEKLFAPDGGLITTLKTPPVRIEILGR